MAKTKEPAQVYQLKITLQDIKPPVWRRIQVKDCSLGKLHDIIQTCMGWTNSHLHAFKVGGEHYSEPYPDGTMETEDERKIKLSQIVDRRHKKFSYTYDFGDNWYHTIQVEKLLDAEPGICYPRCITGKQACPPDDCGGPWGYGSFLEAVQKPDHPEHDEMLEWIGGEFDPEKFDIEAVNEALGRIR